MFESAHQAYGDQVLFIGVDAQDGRGAALRFLADVGVSYPQVYRRECPIRGIGRHHGYSVHCNCGRVRIHCVPAVRHDHDADVEDGAGRRRGGRRDVRLRRQPLAARLKTAGDRPTLRGRGVPRLPADGSVYVWCIRCRSGGG